MARTRSAPEPVRIHFSRFMWGAACLLWLLPAIAMRFTTEVNWTIGDFVFAALLLFGSAGIVELALRARSDFFFCAGVVAAVAAAFLTVWANAAVGMIGNEDNPFNLWFLLIVVLALAGSAMAGFRAPGMAWIMSAAAGAQALAGAIGMASDLRGGIFSILFAGLWILSAAAFHRSTRADGEPAGG